jgi:hypothetical protein
MSCVVDRIVSQAVQVRLLKPIVESTLFRLKNGIELKSIGYALGVWAHCNFDADSSHQELQEAVMESTIEAKLSPKDSNFIWQRGRAALIALDAARNVKLGSTERDEVGHIWDCHRELYGEIMAWIRFRNPGLADAMEEARRASHYRNSDSHWGDES